MATIELIIGLFFVFVLSGLVITGAAKLVKVAEGKFRLYSLLIAIAVFLGVVYFGAFLAKQGYLLI
jgi:hypothetical protein